MKIYNSQTRKKEKFITLEPNKVKMYVCGPTVYNLFHIGNARTFIVFDTIRKYMEYRGFEVQFVQNFTDIDDKMIKRANEEGTTVKEVADKYIEEYYKDADALGIDRATINPKATEYMEKIITFVQELVEKDFAYIVNGDVYFRTNKFESYGKLSGQNLDDLQSGARICIDERKENPMDFAIWKSAKPGEPSWETPWGEGRPGWHIECSCMAQDILGDTIDIHAGGMDLTFPHHENEIAQSEARSGKQFVNYWMHAAYLNINNKKMSKSLNNFIMVRDALKKYDGEVIRFFMLQAHYRNQLNFVGDLLESAKTSLDRLYNVVNHLESLSEQVERELLNEEDEKFIKILEAHKGKYIEKMDDDFNTADAITVLFDLAKDININVDSKSSKALVDSTLNLFRELGEPLGILQKSTKCTLEEEIECLIEQRQQARKDKDWSLADKIRDDLKSRGIVLEDTPEGVRWKKI